MDSADADKELLAAWCASIASRIELMQKEHERDMKDLERRLQEFSENIRSLKKSIEGLTEP